MAINKVYNMHKAKQNIYVCFCVILLHWLDGPFLSESFLSN